MREYRVHTLNFKTPSMPKMDNTSNKYVFEGQKSMFLKSFLHSTGTHSKSLHYYYFFSIFAIEKSAALLQITFIPIL